MTEGWTSYQEDADMSGAIVRHFGGIVFAGPVAPPEKPRKRTVRELRPSDLGLVFHTSCAPQAALSAEKKNELTDLVAELLVNHYYRTLARWAGIRESVGRETTQPRAQAQVASAEGRRVFTFTRTEWAELRTHEGRLVEIDIERTPVGGIEAAASVIVAIAAERALIAERIELWPYSATADPKPAELQHYLVLEQLTVRRLDLPKFAERAGTKDTLALRQYLREHVFVVNTDVDHGRRQAKARVVDQIVFMAVN